MVNINLMESHILEIIDELKGLLADNGLSGDPKEDEIVTTVFLYKFLNDKFMYNLRKFCEKNNKDINAVLNGTDSITLEVFLWKTKMKFHLGLMKLLNI